MTDNKNNTGDYNTGDYNTGRRNTGSSNTGNYNTGSRNTGSSNTGSRNTGYYNTGNYNTGYCNTGDYNTGNYNTGDYNTGYCNTGDYNTGFFNTNTPKVTIFNKISNLEFCDEEIDKLRSIIVNNIKSVCVWIYESDMTGEEKEENPTHKTTGGYLKKRDYKYCWQKGWGKMSDEDKEFIKSLPNFCPKIFEEITGINLYEKKKVTLELTDKQLEEINKILKNEQ